MEQPAIGPYRGSDLEREERIAVDMRMVNMQWRAARCEEQRKEERNPLPSLSDFNPNRWPGRNHLDLTEKSEQWDGNE
jgi:hypothetical protein